MEKFLDEPISDKPNFRNKLTNFKITFALNPDRPPKPHRTPPYRQSIILSQSRFNCVLSDYTEERIAVVAHLYINYLLVPYYV